MRSIIVSFGLLLLGCSPAGATEYEVIPGVTVVGWERLPAENQDRLRSILDATPRAWYPWLRAITVDGAAIPEPLASETCAPKGVYAYGGPCRFNVWAAPAGTENPFSPDAPEAVTVPGFTIVAIHELWHQVGHSLMVDRKGKLLPWQSALIAEAGQDARHYLRSMFDDGFFVDYPQEFVASMGNQWATCSRCTLRLALTRRDQGIVHPLNQVVFLLALSGFRTPMLDDNFQGTVIAFDLAGDVPVPEIWTVVPWRCGGDVQVSGPGFRLGLTLNDQCRVIAVKEREGL